MKKNVKLHHGTEGMDKREGRNVNHASNAE